jgi:hypothetical protein
MPDRPPECAGGRSIIAPSTKEKIIMAQLVLMVLVVLGLPPRNKDLIAFVNTVLLKMTGNAYFPNPTPTLASVGAALTAFESAQTAMSTAKQVAGDRAKKRATLVTLLKHLRDFVQGVCESDIDNAAAIAESAGMRLKKVKKLVKAAFSVVQGRVSGSVVCSVKASGIPTTYYWFYSLDQKSWTSAPDTMTSKVTISGLTPGQLYYFRFRTLNRKGLTDLSQVVSFLVK